MKWLIVEDALRDRKGHWLEYVSTFVRELRALGDELVVLCDGKAQGFVKEQTGARSVLPESIWHRMSDGAGAMRRYLRVPGHAVATFFAMRKVFRGFNREKTRKDTKGDERGAGSREQGEGGRIAPEDGRSEIEDREIKGTTNHTNLHEKEEAGLCLDKPSGAAFSNPFTSELARDSENTSLTRSASGPALAAELPRTDSGELMAEGSKLVPTSATGDALDSGRWALDSGEAPDWIFVPTVLVHHLLGWWMLLKAGSVPNEARVLLFFPNLPIRLDDEGQPHWTGGPTTKLMAWLFENLRGEVASGKVVLGVETHAMRRALEGLLRMPVVYLPHPVEAAQPSREVPKYKAPEFQTTDDTDLHGWRTTIERQGGRENEQPKVGPKGEGVGTTESNHTKLHERGRQGNAQGTCAGTSKPDSLTSKLADSPVSELLIRFADGPAGAAQPPMTDGGPVEYASHSTGERGRRTEEKSDKLVHKSSGGEGSGSMRPEGEISCAGAKPELPVCEQGRGGGHDLTTNHTNLHERGEAGQRLAGQAGAAFSNPSTSELARDSENTSLIRSADAPASSSPATSHPLPATSAKPIVFGCYGAARWEKGSDIFQEAIRLILKNEVASAESRVSSARNQSVAGEKALDAGRVRQWNVQPVESEKNTPPAKHIPAGSTLVPSLLAPSSTLRAPRFAIQWVEDFWDREGNLISIDPWLRGHPQVEVFGRYFEGDEYEQRLAQTDVMVLPYRSPYRLRVSRVVIEAMLNGMPVIATKGTTLFEQAEEYGVVIGCDEGDAASLAKAMLEVAERFEILRASAEEKVNAAAESFSVGYFRELLASVGQNH